MATEVRLPQWSMGMSEGQIVQWYHDVGDHVDEDAPLAAVEAEKTEQDLLSPASGTILEILVTPETGPVPVRTLVAVIGTPDEVPTAPRDQPSHTEATVVAEPPIPVAVDPAPPVVASVDRAARQITPLARRRAKQLGLALDSVDGTGPDGRVTEDDVQRAASAVEPPPPRSAGALTVPLTGMRGAIAKRMHASLQTGAQLTLARLVDVTALVEAQKTLKSYAGISVNDLILRGVAIALTQHPRLNATISGDEIVVHPHVQLGVAVALDDGLIVPVVRDAETKSLADLSREVRDLAARARSGDVSPAEVSNSTFTVTNLGASDIDAFTPIINPPEVAILGVGRVTDVYTRVGDDGQWRSMMTLSLTIDHRAVDGVPGARFLMSLAATLSDVDLLTSPPGDGSRPSE